MRKSRVLKVDITLFRYSKIIITAILRISFVAGINALRESIIANCNNDRK